MPEFRSVREFRVTNVSRAGEFGKVHPNCVLALGFRGLLQPAQAQDRFEIKLQEFLLYHVEAHPTKRALLSLIPKLTADELLRPGSA
jgi:hypothetical protein